MKNKKIETLTIHGGQTIDETGSRGVPIHRTSSFVFKDSQHAADLFGLRAPGYIYSRLGNPTLDVLEQRVALMENGAAALAIASGTSAIFYAIINLAQQGDEIVSANTLYGGTYTMFNNILPQFGITTRMVKLNDFDAWKAAITEKTRCLFVETIGNPTLEVADIEALAHLAHEHGLPLVVDATFTTPYLSRPLEHGADIVVHSLTKWMGGHGTAIGGIVVDGNTFDWKNPRFSLFNEPDESYHGIRWAHDLGDMPPYIVRMRTVPLRNLGACLSADNAWMFLQGLETLHLRMERHSSNALAVAKYIKNHPKTAWVRYPGLESDPSYALSQKYLPNGAGGMVVFGLKGNGKEGGQKFVESLPLFSLLANVGDAKSLALHAASTTHSQLSNEQQVEAGLMPELIRLSIGLEHIDDIINALEVGFSKV